MVVLHPLTGFKCSQQVVVQTGQKCSSRNRWRSCKCVTSIMPSCSGSVWVKKQLHNSGRTPAPLPNTEAFVLASVIPQQEVAK